MAARSADAAQRRLAGLVRRHGSPVMAISRGVLNAQMRRFRRALPRVEPFYAAKANPHPGVLAHLAAAGAGFDVASAAELEAALAAGAPPGRVIFANTIKPSAAIGSAAARGVDLMTFDSEYELDKIAERAPGSRVIVRVKVPNVGSIVELSLKFGADPADAIPLLIKAHRLGLRPAGVSFHVGSQCTRVGNYVEAIETAAIIVRDAALKRIPIDIVDIGGGFPIRQLDRDEDPFDTMAAVISRELDRLFDGHIRIIAEPGRFIVGPAAVLLMRVVGKAIRENRHWYYLDDGIYGDLSGIIFDHAKYGWGVLRKGRRQLSTLAGPTCDSLDIIARGEDLPELEIGDVVYATNIGAYSSASATCFNGIAPAKIVMTQ
ncbi:MAG: type III PLP-dependent enzyme [bacterium]|nr:type III PLP-dependent enzyme [bacterium]